MADPQDLNQPIEEQAQGGASNLLGLSSFLMDLSSVLRTALTHPAGASAATYMLGSKITSSHDAEITASVRKLDYMKRELDSSKQQLEQAGKYNAEVQKTFDLYRSTLGQQERILVAERARLDNARKFAGAVQTAGFSLAQVGEQMEIAGVKYMKGFAPAMMPGTGGTAPGTMAERATTFAYATEKWLAGVQAKYGTEVSERARGLYQNFGQLFMRTGRGKTEDVQQAISNLAMGEGAFGIGGDVLQTLTKGRGYEGVSLEKKLAFINKITEQYSKGSFGALTGPETQQALNAMLAATAATGLGGRERMESSYRYMQLFGRADLPVQSMMGVMQFITPFVSNLRGMNTFQALTGGGPEGALRTFQNDPAKFLLSVSEMTKKYIANPTGVGRAEQVFLDNFFGGNREALTNFSEAVAKLSQNLKDAKGNMDKFSLKEFDKISTLGQVNNLMRIQGGAGEKLPTLLEQISGWTKQNISLPIAEKTGTNVGYAVGAAGTVLSLLLAYTRMQRGKSAAGVVGALVGGQIISDLTKNLLQGDISGAGGLSAQQGGGASQGPIIDPMMALLLLQNMKQGGATGGGGLWGRIAGLANLKTLGRVSGGLMGAYDIYNEVANARTAGDRLKGGVNLVGDALLMSGHPYAMLAGLGIRGLAVPAGDWISGKLGYKPYTPLDVNKTNYNALVAANKWALEGINEISGEGASVRVGNTNRWKWYNEAQWLAMKKKDPRIQSTLDRLTTEQKQLEDFGKSGGAADTGRTSNLGINIIMRNGFGGVMDQASLNMGATESAKQATLFMNVTGITGLA